MDAILGKNCHITLTHANVNQGQPYGFLVNEEHGTRPGGVEITHEVDSGGTTRLWLYFDVVLADAAINPDGSPHLASRDEDYQMLLRYLSQLDGLTLSTPVGAFLNLGAIGWTADERHLPNCSLIKCQINNIGMYWPPIDEDTLKQCVWDGILTWGSSYWR
jgi:hypothetical protein